MAARRLSLVAVSGSHSIVVVLGLLIPVPSHVAEHECSDFSSCGMPA